MTEPVFKSPMEHLQHLRENWLVSAEAETTLMGSVVSHSTNCVIGNDSWNQEVYSDASGNRNFIVFEVWRKRFLLEDHYCIGCEIVDGKYALLTREDLWNEGIP